MTIYVGFVFVDFCGLQGKIKTVKFRPPPLPPILYFRNILTHKIRFFATNAFYHTQNCISLAPFGWLLEVFKVKKLNE